MLDLRTTWESELRAKYGVDADAHAKFLDWLWRKVSADHAFEIENGNPDTSEMLLAAAELPCESIMQFGLGHGVGGRPRGSRGTETDLGKHVKFDSKTKTHVLALSEYLSKIVAVERRVMEFRRRYCGGPTRTVAPAEVPQILKEWSVAPGAESEDDVYLYWTGAPRPSRFRGSYWSAIGTLDRLGDYLAKRYPWTKDQAMHFVLCGGVYQVKTVSGKRSRSVNVGPAAHKFNRGTITLEVEAWMPPELVKKAYSHLQRQLDQGDQMLGESVKPRRGYGRTAEVFRFVVERSEVKVVSEEESLGKLVLPLSWRELRKLWDDHLPTNHSWRYEEKGTRNFYRDFMRGQKAVTSSKQGLPGDPGQPVTAKKASEAFPSFVERLEAQVARNQGN